MAGCARAVILAAALFAAAGLASAQCWTARWSGPSGDEAYLIALDSAGNVCVSGRAYEPIQQDYDIVTVKYDPDGNELWVARYDYAGEKDLPYDLAIDRHGNVYVAGQSSWSGGYFDMVTIKYRPDGEPAWVARYGMPEGGDQAHALALDSLGNVYAAGGSNGDYVIVKYDSAGTQLWDARHRGRGGMWAYDVCLDGDGNVYVTGREGWTIKYDSLGNERWIVCETVWADLYAVAVDQTGAVYAFGSRAAPGCDYSLAKYDSLGRRLWLATYDNGAEDCGRAMILDGHGNIYVSGHSQGANVGLDFCTIKYDTAGNQLWVARYDSGYEWFEGLAISDKSVCIVGASGAAGRKAFCTVVYDTEGRQRWEAKHQGLRTGFGGAVAFDADGYVYATGSITFDSLLRWDYFTIKYDLHGVTVRERGTRSTTPASACPTHVRGLLRPAGNTPGLLRDASGRQLLALRPGENDIRHLSPGVYFVRQDCAGRPFTRKLVVQR